MGAPSHRVCFSLVTNVKTFRAAVTHKKETTWGQERVFSPQVISRQIPQHTYPRERITLKRLAECAADWPRPPPYELG